MFNKDSKFYNLDSDDEEALKDFLERKPDILTYKSLCHSMCELDGKNLKLLAEATIKHLPQKTRHKLFYDAVGTCIYMFVVNENNKFHNFMQTLLEYAEYFVAEAPECAIKRVFELSRNTKYDPHDRVYKVIKTLYDAGALDSFKLPEEHQLADYAYAPNIKALFRQIDKERRKNTQPHGFALEANHLVSHTEKAPVSGVMLTSVFNFKYNIITYVSNDNTERPLIEKFSDATSPELLKAAAEFLESEQGNTYGFKPGLIK